MKRKSLSIVGVMGLLGLAVLVVPTTGQGQEPPKVNAKQAGTPSGKLDKVAQRVSRLSDQMMSPYCKGKTLKTCTSPNAATLRRKIEVMMRAGKSDDAIIKLLQIEFPETKLINPDQPWYTFFVPFLPYIFGASALFLVLLAWRKGGQPHRVAMADMGPMSTEAGAEELHSERLSRLRSRVQEDD